MIDLYLLSILIFIAIFAIIIFRDRKNVEIKGVLFIRRTKKGRKLLDRIARISPKFWKILGSIGVVVCFGAMGYDFYFLFKNLIRPIGVPSLSLVIPFPTKEATIGYGYIGVPFWYFIIGVVSLIFVHEGMHGILARAEKIKIKNVGLLLLAVIPGAFVEPDEKQLKKASWKTKLRIYAGGSFANFLLAGLITLLLSLMVSPLFLTDGVGYVGYVNATQYGEKIYPAQEVNMTEPIISIDGYRIRTTAELAKVMERTKPGQAVTIKTYSNAYNITLAKSPDNPKQGFIGISRVYDVHLIKSKYKGTFFYNVIEFFVKTLSWMWMLNIGVGLVNIFPIKPLDGGLMVEAICERFLPKHKGKIVKLLSALFLFLAVGNFLIGFL